MNEEVKRFADIYAFSPRCIRLLYFHRTEQERKVRHSWTEFFLNHVSCAHIWKSIAALGQNIKIFTGKHNREGLLVQRRYFLMARVFDAISVR